MKALEREIEIDFQQVTLQFKHFESLNSRRHAEIQKEFSSFLEGMLIRRSARMFRFIQNLHNGLIEFKKMLGIDAEKIFIQFTNGDSHGECERAVIFEICGSKYVFKSRDPRPHLALHLVLTKIKEKTAIDAVPPKFWSSPKNDWYVMPFLESRPYASPAQAREFMRSLGVVTAVAHALQMTDVHIDNLIAWNGRPVIIDAECIFYSFTEHGKPPIEDRLLNTGLVSRWANLSSILGAYRSNKAFGAKINNGDLAYVTSESGPSNNRLISKSGLPVNPADFCDEIIDGFEDAYRQICSNRQHLIRELKEITIGMRTRFLLKLTVQYAATLEVLRCPFSGDTATNLGRAIHHFSHAIGLSNTADKETLKCELRDLLDSDIPFFWTEEQESGPALMHWTGRVKYFPSRDSLSKRIGRCIYSCSINDLPRLRKELRSFLLKPSLIEEKITHVSL
ncbi:DUF4135 domain-containing protein [Variovorax boronicumulans]|uniref:DUF4135 domain-containing protein n=1 Tax=Variovorax boronicumulans TaxID=436515 RepID=UPI001C592A9E